MLASFFLLGFGLAQVLTLFRGASKVPAIVLMTVVLGWQANMRLSRPGRPVILYKPWL